jgi:hypothetical protein
MIQAAKGNVFLHMGISKIHWREEGDPIINGMEDRDVFYVRDIFSGPFFWCVFLPVWDVECVVGLLVRSELRYLIYAL